MRLRSSLSLLACLALVGLAAPQAGALSFSLTLDGCSGGCGPAPYGTVEVVQGVDANTVDITVTLNDDNKFVSTGGPHHALAWNIDGNPAISILSLPSDFAVGPAPDGAAPFGPFMYTVDCPGCGPGASNAKPGPLTFSVASAGGLDPSDFIGNPGGFVFSADIISGTTGNTGNVAAVIPEPATALLLLGGLAGLAQAGRRRA